MVAEGDICLPSRPTGELLCSYPAAHSTHVLSAHPSPSEGFWVLLMGSYYFRGLVHGLPLVCADKPLHVDNSVNNDYLLEGQKGWHSELEVTGKK